MIDRQARDLPLDAHLHTDLSPDSAVPIDAYARRPSSAASPRSRSPTTSTSRPARPATARRTFAQRERVVREAAERWADRGVAIRFGVEITYDSRYAAEIRDHLAQPRLRLRHRLRPRLPRLAVRRRQRRRLGRRPVARRDRRAVLRRGRGRRPHRAVRRDRPPRLRQALPGAARDHRGPGRRPGAVRADPARRSSRAARRSRSTRAACASRPRRPTRRRRSSRASARSGGRAVTIGSDAHTSGLVRLGPGATATTSAAAAGFASLAFRRGGERGRAST